MIVILDTVLRTIDEWVGQHAPERGGALLGPMDRPLISRFVYDAEAKTTSASYSPSVTLNKTVRELREQGYDFKGILHSHPGSLDVLSGPDHYELAVGLKENPHMGLYLAPVVTKLRADDSHPHEAGIAGGKVSMYGAHRGRSGGRAEILPLAVRVIPLAAHLEMLQTHLTDVLATPVTLTGCGQEMLGRDTFGGTLSWRDGELMVIVHESYPVSAPMVLSTPSRTNESTIVPLRWDISKSPEDRLLECADWVSLDEGSETPALEVAEFASPKSLATDRSLEVAYLLTGAVVGICLGTLVGLMLGLSEMRKNREDGRNVARLSHLVL